jgi:hypothetical protein
MKSNLMKKIFLLLFIGVFGNGFAQGQNPELIVSQARNMADLLLAKNFTAYSDYIYPGIVMMAGGKETLIEGTKNAMEGMVANGVSIAKISFGVPEKILVVGNEWQTTIPQVVEMKHEDKTIIAEYSLIAISNNNGQHWYFIDTRGKRLEILRKSLPNLSADLVLPAQKEREE